MASSKKPTAEKKRKETKSTKTPNKKNNTSTTKNDPEKNNKTCNGTVNDIISIPSSSIDEEQERSKSASTTKKADSTASKKGKQKRREEEVNDVVDEEEGVGEKEVNDAKMHRFPMNRIKTIVRSEDSGLRITQEALYLINKATDKFLEQFTKDAHVCCVQDRKKTLGYKHLSLVVSKRRRYDFLSDFVPEKIKAQDALAERKVTETKAG
ncbi:DNA polymerase II subunit B3-1 [Alnus glutinosa]|uniref:DNA polymerase II subunit B3-1 n=1 Tax=Alnus glutinosa TaxID=3517 RepID=UPI002D798A88|nr:DNA polymerase II subunit B3-1 [Alnus glutinosa]